MELLLSKQSKIEQALSRIDQRQNKPTHKKGTPMTRRDDNDIFDAQHLTGKDISELEDAANAEDLEVLVAAVDAIVGRHLGTSKKLRH